MPALSSEGLTPEQYTAAQRFHIKVFGTPMFFSEPVCNGKHGWGCTGCYEFMIEREREVERTRAIQQPWEREAA